MGAFADAIPAMKNLLRTADDAPEWRQAKPPQTTMIVVGRVRRFNSTEIELINAYGASGAEIICDAATFGGDAPAKMDTFMFAGQRFVVQLARPDYVEGTLQFWRCFCKT